MDEERRSLLIRHQSDIVRSLCIDHVRDHLISHFIITPDDYERIDSAVTTEDKAAKLLDFIRKKNNNAYTCFYKAMLINGYEHLASLLKPALQQDHNDDFTQGQGRGRAFSISEVRARLLDGNVPPKPAVFANRADIASQIRTNLEKLSQFESGWVVIHGMGGSGKTVAAAESLRYNEIFDHFAGGVIWLNIGKIDKAGLLLKMQNLCQRLVSDNQTCAHPQNIEQAKDKLRHLILHSYPKSLIILDDVWSAKVTRAFDIRCRIMLTTRDSSITNCVSGSVFNVPMTEGFTWEESQQILSSWTGIQLSILPDEASQIHTECRGLPLAVNMIGSLLRDHPRRWEFYLQKLQQGKLSRIKKGLAYEYGTLAEAISLSVDNLNEAAVDDGYDNKKELYLKLAVFNLDVKLPTNVLSVLWGLDKEDTEDLMYIFVKKSLAQRVWDEHWKTYLYSLHNLQMDYVKEQHTADSLKLLHSDIVSQYSKRCHGDYLTLDDDHYAHLYLPMHMALAGMVKEFCGLVTNLDWMEKKLCVAGPASLLIDYIKHSVYSGCDNEDYIKLAIHFVSTSAHLLVESKCPDLTQLSLYLPEQSTFYKQARTRVQNKKKNSFFVDWCNKDSLLVDALRLTSTVHSKSVKCAEFSRDSSLVISCGNDKTFKVWDSSSAAEVLSVEGHRDDVNCVTVSNDSKMLATCSNDRYLKVWLLKTGELLYKYPDESHLSYLPSPSIEHTPSPIHLPQGRTSCMFYPDNSKIVCGSGNGSLLLIDVKEMKYIVSWKAHDENITCCRVAPDNSSIASSSRDHTVKIWHVGDEENLPPLVNLLYNNHQASVECCCYSPDSLSIASASENSIHIWNIESGGSLQHELKSTCSILCCCYSPDGSTLAAGTTYYTIELWDTLLGEIRTVFRRHTGWVHSVNFSQEGNKLVSASDDDTVMVWEVNADSNQQNISVKRDFDAMLVNEDQCLIAATGQNYDLQIFSGMRGDRIHIENHETSRIRVLKISNNGKMIAYGTENGTIKIVRDDTEKGWSNIFQSRSHTGAIRYITFSPDDSMIFTCSDDHTVCVFKWSETQSNFVSSEIFSGHSDRVGGCHLVNFEGALHLLTYSKDGTVRLWGLDDGRTVWICLAHNDWILDCDVSEDEMMAATTSTDMTATIIDVSSGEILHRFSGHTDCVRCCRFSPNDRFLATGDDNGVIKIWDLCLFRCVSQCERHSCWVYDVQFSSDSSMLVSVGDHVKWWSIHGHLLQTFYVKGSFTKSIKTSKDFQIFSTIDSAGCLYLMKKIH